jgi:hypothetical protein
MADNNGGSGALDGFGSNFATLHKYVDIFERGGNARAAFEAVGGQGLGYIDVNFCKGDSRMFSGGPTPYAGPDCSDLPASAFFQDSKGEPLYVDPYGAVSALGDPHSSALVSAAINAITGQDPIGYVWVDDSGPPNTLSTPICPAAYPDPPSFPCSNPVKPNSIVPKATWYADEVKLLDALPVPAFVDDSTLAASAPNAAGAICDNCLYSSTNNYEVTGSVLTSVLAGAFADMDANKLWVLLDENSNDIPTRMRALAIGLLPYRYEQEYFFAAGCSNSSGINECPEITFVADPDPADRNRYPQSISGITDPSGALIRNFRECYIAGVAQGACTAIDNPNLTTSITVPSALVGAPTLTAHGNPQVCGEPSCVGTAGWVAFDGPAMPSSLPGATAYVVGPPPADVRRSTRANHLGHF